MILYNKTYLYEEIRYHHLMCVTIYNQTSIFYISFKGLSFYKFISASKQGRS